MALVTPSQTSYALASVSGLARSRHSAAVLRVSSSPTLGSQLVYHIHTLLLFTAADLKTIFFPVSAFACATAPLHSTRRLLLGWLWIWLHQLMCNVSNQAKGRAEDAVNKPWRPLPSGRITESKAALLRWVVVGACMLCSATYGSDVLIATAALFLTTLVYDEGGLAGHWIGKNLCNIGGYTTFEIGATKIMGANRDLDSTSVVAILISGLVIFTTIQAQDFADVDGDKRIERITFPIYAPQLSRKCTLIAMIAWSAFLAWFWDTGLLVCTLFVSLGVAIGIRFYIWRAAESDRLSYILYNIWLMFVHVLPLHARVGVANV